LGRRIYDNLKKAMSYLIAIHVPIAGMSLLPVLTKLPIVLFPAHIAFMEFIIDPSCSMVFESENEDADIMKRPPRNIRASLFNRKSVAISFLQGFGMLVINYAFYFYIIFSGRSELESRSFAFATLVLSNLLLILVNLSWNQSIIWVVRNANKMLIAVLSITILSLFSVVYIPFLSDLFHMAPLGLSDLFLLCLIISIGLGWFQFLKLFRRRDSVL
jgi:Ca2+-transporting ATPase